MTVSLSDSTTPFELGVFYNPLVINRTSSSHRSTCFPNPVFLAALCPAAPCRVGAPSPAHTAGRSVWLGSHGRHGIPNGMCGMCRAYGTLSHVFPTHFSNVLCLKWIIKPVWILQ